MILVKFIILFVLGLALIIIITAILNDTVFKTWDPFKPLKKFYDGMFKPNNLSVVEKAKRANKKR